MKRFGRLQRAPLFGKRISCALYRAWCNMRRRRKSDHPVYYSWYKAKGVKCCEEWRDYAVFRSWALANGFRKGLWIDRIDGDGDYAPQNCRWVTRDEQMVNQSHVHQLTLNGVTKPMPVWARELGFDPALFRVRKTSDWSDRDILTTPKGARRAQIY